jgi:predicted ATP-grasp superfamily ATP-dependent carboligase
MIAGRTPALLLMAEYNGTLAAARCLSGHGTPVTIATSSVLAPSRWSNAVGRVESCPDFGEGPDRLAEWLVAYGASNPRHVLYPTCDEMAWLLAHHHSQLSQHFYMYSPQGETLRTLLDKRHLYDAAAAAGLATPRTWHPHSEQELAGILEQVGAVLVKPRSQTFFKTHAKGGHAASLSELTRLWKEYRDSGYAAEVTREIGDLDFPMIQEYLPEAAGAVTSISGFAIRSGRIIDSRASKKVLQFPPRAGVGLCFESAGVDPVLLERLAALCRNIGYHGVFEAEFIRHDGRDLLIDFNPRYFGQVGFDIARGMQLPWLAQLCATGNEKAAERFVRLSAASPGPSYYADSLALRWHLSIGALFGTVSATERRKWLAWLAARPDSFADAVLHSGDTVPGLVAAAGKLWYALRHPRGFWRSRYTAPHADLRTAGSRGHPLWRVIFFALLGVLLLGVVARVTMA